MNLLYGSRGDDVKKLQSALNNQGYNLAVDGIYGTNTQAAVRDYQSKNGLAVDGIFGVQTSGKLYGTASGGTGGGTAETVQTPSYRYDPSSDAAYQTARQSLQALQQQGAPVYQAAYDKQMDEIYNKIMNRQDFSFDVNGDALYNQYKELYTQQGRQAMMDTMGQAAALTGGYDSSYAQSVGQQQYDAYLQQLNAVTPELYAQALSQYNQEGDELLQQYSLLSDRSSAAYSRYLDEYNQYMAAMQNLQNQEETAYNRGYQDWRNSEETGYQRQQDAYDRAIALITTTGHIPDAQTLANAGMSQEEAQYWLSYYNRQQMNP